MSNLIVEICRIELVKPHPDADSIELVHIKGWQCVVPKGKYKAGDAVVYIPIDAVIPVEHSDAWGITKYLSNGRVRCARLRGEPSFGVIIDPPFAGARLGTDMKDYYGITKYIPPINLQAGDAEVPHGLFTGWTDIENLRNFPDIFEPGEEVIFTEKIHGTCCRVGIVEGEEMAGSMELRRKRPESPDQYPTSTYWHPFSIAGVRALLNHFRAGGHEQVILYGEVYGAKIHTLKYGLTHSIEFRAFGLKLDEQYVHMEDFMTLCNLFDVPRVPTLYRGPFSMEEVIKHANGKTTLGADHIREGIVIYPVAERRHPRVGRVCLKYISDDFLLDRRIPDINDV